MKALHRLIVTSATFRQRSQATRVARWRTTRKTAGWRAGRGFGWPAEVVRDNALAIAGLLVKRIGGPSVKPYQPAGLWEELAGGAGEAPYVQDKGPQLYRRSLYVYRKRTVPHPIMATFDAPSREVCQVKRPRTNTPLQALELLNDLTYVEAARQLAQHRDQRRRLEPDSQRLVYRIPPSPGPLAVDRRARAAAARAEAISRDVRADPAAAQRIDPARRQPA